MKNWIGCVCVLAFVGCGDDGGGSGDGPEDPVTLAALPDAERAVFATWQHQVIKDCAWQQAFPSLDAEFPSQPYAPVPRVDVHALLDATAGTRLVKGAAGELALLDRAPLDVTSSHDAHTARHSINGVGRVLEVSANRDGNTCVIMLGGEEVFRGELAATLPVVAAYDPAARVTAKPSLPALIDGRPGADAVAALDTAALLAPSTAALQPTASAQAFLATRFAITREVAKAAFPLRGGRIGEVVRLDVPGTTPFAPGAQAFGPRDAFVAALSGIPIRLDLLFDGLDAELVVLRVELAVGPGGKAPTLTAITAGAPVAHDDAAARACFLARGVASRFEPAAPHAPSFETQLTGCGHLAVDSYAALAADPTTRAVIAGKAFGDGVVPQMYRGWDAAAIAIAQRLAAQGTPLAALDPAGTLPELTQALARYATLRAAPEEAAVQRALEPGLITVTFRWFFGGLTPSPALLGDLASTLRNAAPYYARSVDEMLVELGDSVAATSRGARAAACGVALIGARRGEIDHAIASVAVIPHGERASEEIRANVLQSCPSASAVATLEASVAAAASFITADAARAGASAGFTAAAEDLIRHALAEGWAPATFDALVAVLDFALVSDSTFCATYSAYAEQAACVDASLELLSAQGDGILAPAVVDRYAAMARELKARWRTLEDARFVTTKLDITQAWSSGLWRACTTDGFARSKVKLYALLDQLAVAGDLDRFELVRQIAALVDAQTCS